MGQLAQNIQDATIQYLRPRGNPQGKITAADQRAVMGVVQDSIEQLEALVGGGGLVFYNYDGEPDASIGNSGTVAWSKVTGDMWQKLESGEWELQFTIPVNSGPGGPFTIEGITEFRDRFGETFTGTSEEAWRQLLVREQIPTYAQPAAGINPSQAGLVKRGTNVTPTIGMTFTQGDAGALVAYQLRRGAVVLASDITPPILYPNYADTYTIGEETVVYKVTFEYGQGAEKQTSQGNPAPGRIPAGTKEATFELRGIMPWYCGSSDSDTLPDIYATGTEFIALSNGQLYVPSFGAGSKWLWFAVPRNADGSRQKLFTTWFRTALDNGPIGGSANLFRAPVIHPATSTGLPANWTRDYDLYFSNYPTAAGTATTLN